LTTIISVLTSRQLTLALKKLLLATRRVSEGDFAVRVKIENQDEFGALGTSFNTMAAEVSRLMAETAQKARMEAELATAKAVQETLFPVAHAQLGPLQIAGHYTPASECGGDWWYHCEIGDYVFLWIGDATGHGAPAALLTSAARAVASVIETTYIIRPEAAMSLLNRAICDASKGKMMMTFFLAVIDRLTGRMEYVNASHEPPLLLHHSDGLGGRADFLPLNDVNNPRLGEDPSVEFKQSVVILSPGDRLIFYTDGVTDVKNPQDKAWGERRFLKTLGKSLHDYSDVVVAISDVVQQIEIYRDATPLEDDVTLFVCSYDDAA
jgi:sigma-B regulation protein RsbU (phosphoserine phosphatase)